MMGDNIGKIFFTEEQIQNRVEELGAQITADYSGCNEGIFCVGILKGASVLFTDLVR